MLERDRHLASPLFYFGTRHDQQDVFGLSNATLLAQGLHVSTTAEPHRTVMRGVEEGARGGGGWWKG